jgi:hypothetical protein
MGVYFIFIEEYSNYAPPSLDIEHGMWYIHFDGACSSILSGYLTLS